MSAFAVKEWWEITPVEDVPWYPGEGDEMEAFVQVFDAAAAEAMHRAFQARKAADPEYVGILVDWDHESSDLTKRTSGAGYIVDTKVEGGKLYGKHRLSSEGEKDVCGGVYRFTSPSILPRDFEDLGGGRKRPLDLDSVAITNRPRCKTLSPISNSLREPGPVVRNTETSGAPPETPNKKHMQKIAELLGLPPEASEDDILAAISSLKESAAAAQASAAERDAAIGDLRQEITNRDTALADALLDIHGITEEAERSAFRPLVIGNRESGSAALKALKAARDAAKAAIAVAPVHNRATTTSPDATKPGEELTGIERTRAAFRKSKKGV